MVWKESSGILTIDRKIPIISSCRRNDRHWSEYTLAQCDSSDSGVVSGGRNDENDGTVRVVNGWRTDMLLKPIHNNGLFVGGDVGVLVGCSQALYSVVGR